MDTEQRYFPLTVEQFQKGPSKIAQGEGLYARELQLKGGFAILEEPSIQSFRKKVKEEVIEKEKQRWEKEGFWHFELACSKEKNEELVVLDGVPFSWERVRKEKMCKMSADAQGLRSEGHLLF